MERRRGPAMNGFSHQKSKLQLIQNRGKEPQRKEYKFIKIFYLLFPGISWDIPSAQRRREPRKELKAVFFFRTSAIGSRVRGEVSED